MNRFSRFWIGFLLGKILAYVELIAVFQTHHISYEPPITVRITKGEHQILFLLGRHRYVTVGFIAALKAWIALHEREAQIVA